MTYIEYKDDDSKFAIKGADVSESHEGYRNAGWLLTENDLIVDIDNLPKETIKAMLKEFNINTCTVWTERGAHLYFKKEPTFKGRESVSPLGFTVEYKHIANTRAITVKRQGEHRKVENEGVRESLPFALSNSIKKIDNLLGLDEGDGRNNKLFKHKMKLANHPQSDKILSFINDFIFAEPMDDKEFEQVARPVKNVDKDEDEAYARANEIINLFGIVRYSNMLYFKDNEGEYSDDEDVLVQHIFNLVGGKRTNFVDEVLKQIKYRSKIIPTDTQFPIRFRNGILQDGEFIPVQYNEFTPYVIDVNYKEDATPVQEVDDYLNLLTGNESEYRDLLLEIIGHTLIVNKEFKRMMGKFFIFIGSGGNGKGTLLQIIRQILNGSNCSALSIKNMSDERYFSQMKGKLANLGDDIQDEPINNEQMKILKNISTCDFVSMRQLYKQSENVELTCSLIFTSNHILKSFEKGTAYQRRVLWLPMFSTPTKKDPKFISKLTTEEAMEYWIRLIVEGYMRLYTNAAFTESKAVSDYNAGYHEENDTSKMFLQDLTHDEIEGLRPPEIYDEYISFCEENGTNEQSKKQFQSSILELFGLVPKPIKKNGKTMRVYVEAGQ
ncbi:phage/plasmid primase, P4 family [Staphylococcus aureus]